MLFIFDFDSDFGCDTHLGTVMLSRLLQPPVPCAPSLPPSLTN